MTMDHDMPWDSSTQEWIDCVKPFFPNDLYLAKQALSAKLDTSMPDWTLTLIVMFLFDGVAIRNRTLAKKQCPSNTMIYQPYGSDDYSTVACEFLNDKQTKVFAVRRL